VKPRLYIETTIPSYLTARPNPLIRIAANQQTTREWWDTKRNEFELFISDFVFDEAAAGDEVFAQKRLAVIAGIPLLEVTEEVDELAARLLEKGLIPLNAELDAFHVAVAAVHAMDFLLTWNCKHINNVSIIRRIERICAQSGFACPVICSPDELLP
jgi:hypothetical protein